MADAPEGTDPDGPDEEPGWAKSLRRDAAAAKKEADQLREQLAARDRADAFKAAGIPDTPLGQMFAKAYDGDVDPDKIRAAALEAKLIEQQPTTPQPEQDAHTRMQTILTGDQSRQEFTNNVFAAAEAEYRAAAKDGILTEQVAASILEKHGLTPIRQ